MRSGPPREGFRPGEGREDVAGKTDGIVLRLLVLLGAALMLLASAAGAEETVTRTDRFSASLAAGSTLRIENVSGHVVAAPGAQFSAVATVTVAAPTRDRAQEILDRVRLLQSRDGNGFSIETRWPEIRWRSTPGRVGRRWSPSRCEDCRINARFDVTVPRGVTVLLSTVNGDVRVRDLDGDLDLSTVNGRVEAQAVRRSIEAQSVNGDVIVEAAAVPRGATLELETVNGAVRLTLPKDARFDLSASTMQGAISSTFPLPARPIPSEESLLRPLPPRDGKPVKRVVVRGEGGEPVIVDLRELEREIERSMRHVDVGMDEAVHDGVAGAVREGVRQGVRGGSRGGIRAVTLLDPMRSYSGRIGDGGARVRLSALNGSILLLAGGTRPEDARPVVSERRSFVVTIPRIRVRVPEIDVRVPGVEVRVPAIKVDVPEVEMRVPRPAVEVRTRPVRRLVWATDAPVVRGNVAGDFLATGGTSSYRIGEVSGRVKILTHSGEIVIASAGAGADVKTMGGDIHIGPVEGDLAAQTLAGDVRAAAVSGSARVLTSGGDIRIEKVGGRLDAKTAGGDIVVPMAAGPLRAQTAGGDVRIAVTARQLREGVSIVNGGGDVTLTLPADFRGDLDLTVTEADPAERAIRSEFSEIATSRRNGTVRGSGSLNGGGERVRVQTSSGTIRLVRGPAAQK